MTAEPGVNFARTDEAIGVATDGQTSGLVFPEAKLDEERTSVVRIDLEAERAGPFYVQWSRQGEKGWITKAVAPRRLDAGRQQFYVEVRDPLARGPIRLIPSPDAGALRVYAAEIRAVEW